MEGAGPILNELMWNLKPSTLYYRARCSSHIRSYSGRFLVTLYCMLSISLLLDSGLYIFFSRVCERQLIRLSYRSELHILLFKIIILAVYISKLPDVLGVDTMFVFNLFLSIVFLSLASDQVVVNTNLL